MCSCPSYLTSRFLLCKHLVRQANVSLGSKPCTDLRFFPSYVRPGMRLSTVYPVSIVQNSKKTTGNWRMSKQISLSWEGTLQESGLVLKKEAGGRQWDQRCQGLRVGSQVHERSLRTKTQRGKNQKIATMSRCRGSRWQWRTLTITKREWENMIMFMALNGILTNYPLDSRCTSLPVKYCIWSDVLMIF